MLKIYLVKAMSLKEKESSHANGLEAVTKKVMDKDLHDLW